MDKKNSCFLKIPKNILVPGITIDSTIILESHNLCPVAILIKKLRFLIIGSITNSLHIADPALPGFNKTIG